MKRSELREIRKRWENEEMTAQELDRICELWGDEDRLAGRDIRRLVLALKQAWKERDDAIIASGEIALKEIENAPPSTADEILEAAALNEIVKARINKQLHEVEQAYNGGMEDAAKFVEEKIETWRHCSAEVSTMIRQLKKEGVK